MLGERIGTTMSMLASEDVCDTETSCGSGCRKSLENKDPVEDLIMTNEE